MDFFGYQKCSTCRKAHKYLTEHGLDLEFHDFVVNPPDVSTLQVWAQRAGTVAALINRQGTHFRELGLRNKELADSEWLHLLSQDGKLIKRPILVTDSGVVVGFDVAAYDQILAALQ
ncbi:Spx/MgsR family RNA polymerase-binding regulatory protein [Alicyclobacillaceae bacterium I2511]|nr:Spx/MgsR family RNA polymerase-binding regulatory protein [Alicyclobacillaceae bacterium I2511]